MNQSYRLVWSAVRGAWAVVSELAKSHAKSGTAMVVVAAATVAAPVWAEGAVVDGMTFSSGLILDASAASEEGDRYSNSTITSSNGPGVTLLTDATNGRSSYISVIGNNITRPLHEHLKQAHKMQKVKFWFKF